MRAWCWLGCRSFVPGVCLMPETVGLLILSTIGATTSVTGIGTAAVTLEIAGATFSAASIVGSAAIIGASIGLQYALSNPDVPKPENGAQPLKQSVPSRQRGYWTNRLSGYYLLFLGAGGDSQDMLAFHSGPIESVSATLSARSAGQYNPGSYT